MLLRRPVSRGVDSGHMTWTRVTNLMLSEVTRQKFEHCVVSEDKTQTHSLDALQRRCSPFGVRWVFLEEGRWGGGGGGGRVFPDSLEPVCNSLIETEWDVLITPVVKTKGGERMWALISGGGSLKMRRDVPYKYRGTVRTATFNQDWPAAASSTPRQTKGFTLLTISNHERTFFHWVDGSEQPACRYRNHLPQRTCCLWDTFRESAGFLLQTQAWKCSWAAAAAAWQQEPWPPHVRSLQFHSEPSAASNLSQQSRYVEQSTSHYSTFIFLSVAHNMLIPAVVTQVISLNILQHWNTS